MRFIAVGIAVMLASTLGLPGAPALAGGTSTTAYVETDLTDLWQDTLTVDPDTTLTQLTDGVQLPHVDHTYDVILREIQGICTVTVERDGIPDASLTCDDAFRLWYYEECSSAITSGGQMTITPCAYAGYAEYPNGANTRVGFRHMMKKEGTAAAIYDNQLNDQTPPKTYQDVSANAVVVNCPAKVFAWMNITTTGSALGNLFNSDTEVMNC